MTRDVVGLFTFMDRQDELYHPGHLLDQMPVGHEPEPFGILGEPAMFPEIDLHETSIGCVDEQVIGIVVRPVVPTSLELFFGKRDLHDGGGDRAADVYFHPRRSLASPGVIVGRPIASLTFLCAS